MPTVVIPQPRSVSAAIARLNRRRTPLEGIVLAMPPMLGGTRGAD
jgi:hypothetical protein